MLKEQIVVGKAYVNDRAQVLREVVEEVDEERVRFNAFELQTGRLLPTRHRTWARSDMASWAQREARPEERALVHPYDAEAGAGASAPATNRGVPLDIAKAALEVGRAPHSFP